ncbi:MAG: NAD-dependent epimerase/dehydratase family protein [Solirubrobacteraceae bacterium]
MWCWPTSSAGAAGFVGANLVRRLLADGHEVTAAVRPDTNRWRLAGVQPDLRVLGLDLLDTAAIETVVATARPDWVFHLAAHGASSWQRDPLRIMQTNALATVALAEASRACDCQAFIHAGSSSEYGFKDHAPSEDEPLEPNSAYAAAKAAATLYLTHLAAAGELDAVTHSVYGPFEGPHKLVPTLIVRGLCGELPPLVNPAVARDFIASDDAVEALMLAARNAPERPGRVYNIGSGRQTTIGELVELVRQLLQIEAKPNWGTAPERTWDTQTWVADPRRAAQELGWQPQLDLNEGLSRTIDWLRSTPETRKAYGLDH